MANGAVLLTHRHSWVGASANPVRFRHAVLSWWGTRLVRARGLSTCWRVLHGTIAIGSWRLVLRSGDERKSSIDGPVGGGLELQRQREHRGQVRTAPAL